MEILWHSEVVISGVHECKDVFRFMNSFNYAVSQVDINRPLLWVRSSANRVKWFVQICALFANFCMATPNNRFPSFRNWILRNTPHYPSARDRMLLRNQCIITKQKKLEIISVNFRKLKLLLDSFAIANCILHLSSEKVNEFHKISHKKSATPL